MTADVIIPVYHPGKEFSVLLERLTEQTAVIHRIIAMNTEENYWNKELEQKYPLLEVHRGVLFRSFCDGRHFAYRSTPSDKGTI